MRIVHVITKGDVGGAQTHVVELARAQRSGGDDVRVVAGTDGPAVDQLVCSGIDVTVVSKLGRARTSPFELGALRSVMDAIAKATPDIVHAHSSTAGVLGRIAARRLHVASVYTAHGWPFQAGAPAIQRCISLVGEFLGGRLGDAVICLTAAETQRARHVRVVPNDRLWTVPNGIGDIGPQLLRSAREWRPISGASPMSIVMVARFAPPKEQAELIEAMATMTDLPWILTFVGDGPTLAACEEMSRRLLGPRARFLGHRDDVPAILANSDAAILWSRYEGMPISLLEAMRAGVCCIGNDLPGVRELFGEPLAGVIAGTSAELFDALRHLSGEPSRIRAFGDLARLRYETSYTASAMAARTRRVYEDVIERRSSAGSRSRNRVVRR